jgi:Tol biopolymer transport system component
MTRVVGLALSALVAACAGQSVPTPTPTPAPTVGATSPPSATASPSPFAEQPWILFSAGVKDPDEPEPHDAVYLVHPDGTDLHRLVHEMYGSEIRATWSPDGSQVAYVQTTLDTGPEGGIFVVNVDGSDPHRIYECAAWCNSTDYLDWASDGRIYVGIDSASDNGQDPPLKFEIWRVDPETGEAAVVLSRDGDGLTVEQQRVSPDGTQLVYVRVRLSNESWAIFVCDMVGGPERQLTSWDLNAAYPDWSARNVISFNTNDLRLRYLGSHSIYTVLPDGTGPTQLQVEAGHARWTPDGNRLTFSILRNGNLFLASMDADGGYQVLVPGSVVGAFSELQPLETGND